jgi:hypothetical protein
MDALHLTDRPVAETLTVTLVHFLLGEKQGLVTDSHLYSLLATPQTPSRRI